MSNKSAGTAFEKIFAKLLSERGFWRTGFRIIKTDSRLILSLLKIVIHMSLIVKTVPEDILILTVSRKIKKARWIFGRNAVIIRDVCCQVSR